MDLWTKLKNENLPIILYGMGDGAEKIITALKSFGLSPSGIFCSNEFHREKTFAGFKVMTYDQIKSIYKEFIILQAFGTYKEEVIDWVNELSTKHQLYFPDVPVIGDNLFTQDFYDQHKDKLDQVCNLLADEQSKMVFKKTIEYKLSGNFKLLFDCESNLTTDQKELLDLNDNEIFLDLGAYKGDTVEEFIALVDGKYKKIIAVEPDKKNYNKLLLTTQNMNDVECINAAIGEADGIMEFSYKGGRNSRRESGGTSIAMVSIDSAAADASFIKMDVEGQESSAIIGGKKTIEKNKPKMQIAGYHRCEDLFALPLQVLEINPDYKVYLRHSRCLPAWDTNFFFC